MRRFWVLVGLLFLALAAPSVSARAQGGANDAAVQQAVAYIRTQQAADGTFAGFGASSTADAIYALAAANVNVAEFTNGGASAVEGLTRLAPEAAKEVGVAAKYLMAALLAGQNPRALGGIDLVAAVQNGFDPATEQYGKDVSSHALALLALGAAGDTVRLAAIAKLGQLQLPDGGWSFDGAAATGSDTNTTALAIQALVSTRGGPEERNKALAYLRTQQNADGGFPYSQTSQFGNASDANSTALVIQAILATGDTLGNWAREGKTPLDRLLAFQNPSGAFRYQDTPPEDNALATYQAVPAVVGKTFPVEPIAIALPGIEPVAPAPVAGGPTPLPATGSSTVPAALAAIAGLLMFATGVALRRRSA